jgi:hypothetical protein
MEGISALAMGISRKYENNLNALPAVVGELDDVVRDPQVEGANGVLPGTIQKDSPRDCRQLRIAPFRAILLREKRLIFSSLDLWRWKQSATNSSQPGIPWYQGILQGNARAEHRA